MTVTIANTSNLIVRTRRRSGDRLDLEVRRHHEHRGDAVETVDALNAIRGRIEPIVDSNRSDTSGVYRIDTASADISTPGMQHRVDAFIQATRLHNPHIELVWSSTLRPNNLGVTAADVNGFGQIANPGTSRTSSNWLGTTSGIITVAKVNTNSDGIFDHTPLLDDWYKAAALIENYDGNLWRRIPPGGALPANPRLRLSNGVIRVEIDPDRLVVNAARGRNWSHEWQFQLNMYRVKQKMRTIRIVRNDVDAVAVTVATRSTDQPSHEWTFTLYRGQYNIAVTAHHNLEYEIRPYADIITIQKGTHYETLQRYGLGDSMYGPAETGGEKWTLTAANIHSLTDGWLRCHQGSSFAIGVVHHPGDVARTVRTVKEFFAGVSYRQRVRWSL